MINEQVSRDECICEDYLDGKEINELARVNGVSEKRISQILAEHEVRRRPRRNTDKRPRHNR